MNIFLEIIDGASVVYLVCWAVLALVVVVSVAWTLFYCVKPFR